MIRKSLIILIMIVLAVVAGIYAYWSFNPYEDIVPVVVGLSTSPATSTQSMEITTKASSITTDTSATSAQREVDEHSGMKHYHNDEFGFEFWYPNDWRIEENTFGSPASKFNMAVQPPIIREMFEPFSINIVTPEFVERGFSDMRTAASPVSVGGKQGLKYTFVTDGVIHQTALIFPLGDNMIIVSTQDKYQKVFDQILSTFTFAFNHSGME